MNCRVGLDERGWVEALQHRARCSRESVERGVVQVWKPILAYGPDRIDEDEASDSTLIAFDAQYGDAPSPRVPQHVPFSETHRLSQSDEVSGVVLDAGGLRAWWGGGFASSPLIVEDELSLFGQGRERGPEQLVPEEETAVDADQRRGASYRRGGEHGELEPSRLDSMVMEPRRMGKGASVGDESVASGGYHRLVATAM